MGTDTAAITAAIGARGAISPANLYPVILLMPMNLPKAPMADKPRSCHLRHAGKGPLGKSLRPL